MWLVVGLGNPGAEYSLTRHNIGFMAIDVLSEGARFTNKFQGETASIELAGEKLILLKPLTYMNHSGRSVQAAMAFYKIPPANVIVLHDELDLPLGKIRIKQAGGANGHNGIRDIDEMVGPDYWRIRLGIGHPGDKNRVHDYVLQRFTSAEQEEVANVIGAVAEHFAEFFKAKPEMLATRVAAQLNPPQPKPKKPAAEDAVD